MTPEGRIKAMVKKALDAYFEKHWRFMPVQTGYGSPALDFLVCVNGWFIAIETKKDDKSKLTPLQQSTKADMEAAGGLVLVVYDQNTCDRAMRIIHGICVNGRDRHYVSEEEQAQTTTEHQGSEQQGETVAAATGRHHGAPRKEPRRRSVTSPRGEDQRVTAPVTGPFTPPSTTRGPCECQAIKGSLGEPLIKVCAYCKANMER